MSVTSMGHWNDERAEWFLQHERKRLAAGGAERMECPLCMAARTDEPCPCCKGKGSVRITLFRQFVAAAFAGIIDDDVMKRL